MNIRTEALQRAALASRLSDIEAVLGAPLADHTAKRVAAEKAAKLAKKAVLPISGESQAQMQARLDQQNALIAEAVRVATEAAFAKAAEENKKALAAMLAAVQEKKQA